MSLDIKIYDKIVEVSERLAKIEAIQDSVNSRLEKIETQDQVQNNLLADHIKGVRLTNVRLDEEKKLRELAEKELDLRVKTLETVPNFFKTLKLIVLYIAPVGAGIIAIVKWFL